MNTPNSKSLNPLISCICVTRLKPEMLKKVINCFQKQSYDNKELIIVYESTDFLTKSYLKEQVNSYNIVKQEVECSPKNTLGMLRNLALEISNGVYFCQWDDDDWYHECRLEYQFNYLKNSAYKGCVLLQWIIYNSKVRKAYLSNKRPWEGSIMAEIEFVKQKGYDNKSLGEDTPVIDFLLQEKTLYLINNRPYLYIYNYHGNNSWGKSHWESIIQSSEEMSFYISNIVSKIFFTDLNYSLSSKNILEAINAIRQND